MKVTKYVPVWQVTIKGKVFSPATGGKTPIALPDLPKDELKRLLDMGAIRKIEFDDGAPDPDAAKAAAKAAKEAAAKKAAEEAAVKAADDAAASQSQTGA